MDNLFKVPMAGEIMEDITADRIIECRSSFHADLMIAQLNFRTKFTEKCGFVFWTKSSMDELAAFIKDEKWLEVMSGTGYLGNTMNSVYHTNIIMTDNKSWKKCMWSDNDTYKNIEQLDALDAIDKYHDEVKGIIMSWPPYAEPIAAKILSKCYDYKLPILYIGEGPGGCTADDEFFELLDDDEKYSCEYDIIPSLWQFPGIHDYAMLITMK